MSAQKLNLMITNKTKCLDLINHLMSREIIVEDRKQINKSKRLEIKETEKTIINELKEF